MAYTSDASPGDNPGALNALGISVDNWYANVQSVVRLGGSTARNSELGFLQSAPDAQKKGFEEPNTNLGIGGDFLGKYLGADLNLQTIFDRKSGETSESKFNIAELHSELRDNLALSAGTYRTPFGLSNMYDVRNWQWFDGPVIRHRLLGQSGLNSLGVHVSYETEGIRDPKSGLSDGMRFHFGVKDLEGSKNSNLVGFGVPIAGYAAVSNDGRKFWDLVWSGRVEGVHIVSTPGAEQLLIEAGCSGIYGGNLSGSDGKTWVAGADLRLRRFVPSSYTVDKKKVWVLSNWLQAEIMGRRFFADDVSNGMGGVLGSRNLYDVGMYVEYFHAFSHDPNNDTFAGIRLDYTRGKGSTFKGFDGANAPVFESRDQDPLRHDRLRLSLVGVHTLSFQKTSLVNKFVGRVRVQYSHDRAEILRNDHSHTVWIGFEVTATRGGSAQAK